MTGRTSWWARDAATHDRELVVESGEEFGPPGPYLLTVLGDLAQQQRSEGTVKTGFRSLSRKVFCTPDEARAVVEHAARIGALDELVIDEDGRRFVCRVSGWQADQERGREALKKATYRAGRDSSTEEGDMSPDNGTSPPDVPPAQVRVDLTRPDQNTSPAASGGAVVVRFDGKPVPAPRLELATAILTDFNAQAGTSYKPLTGRGRPSEDLKRILGALVDADPPLTLDEAKRITNVRLRTPFWTGKPSPGVVFGPKIFAANREAATATRNGATDSDRLAAALATRSQAA